MKRDLDLFIQKTSTRIYQLHRTPVHGVRAQSCAVTEVQRALEGAAYLVSLFQVHLGVENKPASQRKRSEHMVCQGYGGFLLALLSLLSMLSTGCFWYAWIRSCLKANSKYLISCCDCGSLGAALSSREECRGSCHLHGQTRHAHHR